MTKEKSGLKSPYAWAGAIVVIVILFFMIFYVGNIAYNEQMKVINTYKADMDRAVANGTMKMAFGYYYYPVPSDRTFTVQGDWLNHISDQVLTTDGKVYVLINYGPGYFTVDVGFFDYKNLTTSQVLGIVPEQVFINGGNA